MENLRRQMRAERRAQQTASPGVLASLMRTVTVAEARALPPDRVLHHPGQQYHIAGSCMENPSPRNEDDRNLVGKGENEPFFHISWRTEEEAQKRYRLRAFGFIFGGAALSWCAWDSAE